MSEWVPVVQGGEAAGSRAIGGWLSMAAVVLGLVVAAAVREQAKQLAADLMPHGAGKATATPPPATAGTASTRRGGLMVDQDPPQRVD
jgi:hypothetical protein